MIGAVVAVVAIIIIGFGVLVGIHYALNQNANFWEADFWTNWSSSSSSPPAPTPNPPGPPTPVTPPPPPPVTPPTPPPPTPVTPPSSTKPEVYYASTSPSIYSVNFDQAQSLATKLGGQIATPDQLSDAQKSGAQWCATGWLSDKSQAYPMKTSVSQCGGPGIVKYSRDTSGATIYGVKPAPGTYLNCHDSKLNTQPANTPCILDFYDGINLPTTDNKYSMYA